MTSTVEKPHQVLKTKIRRINTSVGENMDDRIDDRIVIFPRLFIFRRVIINYQQGLEYVW